MPVTSPVKVTDVGDESNLEQAPPKMPVTSPVKVTDDGNESNLEKAPAKMPVTSPVKATDDGKESNLEKAPAKRIKLSSESDYKPYKKSMSGQPIDTNCMTLTRFVLAEQRKYPTAVGNLSQLLTSIQSAVKAISAAVRRAGIANLGGAAGDTNVQGEDVQKLDVLSNELFINMLRSSYTCCLLVSEENETVIEVDTAHCGKYIVTFDPLDGSSNIDCLVSIGSIWGIFKKPDDAVYPFDPKIALQKGTNMVSAGYALYGSATMMVIAQNNEVNGFMLDPSIGEFVLTDPRMTIPKVGAGKKNLYSINEGYENKWEPAVLEYVKSKKVGPKPYGARYIGSMVADVHRTIKYGGVFMYPSTTDAPKGKLRVLYECFPMAYIVENAGGKATDGKKPILEIEPTGLHVRSPIFLGSSDDVDDILAIMEKHA